MTSYANRDDYVKDVLRRIRNIARKENDLAAMQQIAQLATEALRTFSGGE